MRELEERTWRQYDHLACVLAFDRERVRSALISLDTGDAVATAALADLAATDPGLAAAVVETRARRATALARRATPLADALALELLERLDAEPNDRALLAVLGDHLQQRGDERGELIALDLAASADPATSARRRELTVALSPALGSSDRAVPGVGFLRELELWVQGPLADHAEVLAHPACRLVRVMRVVVHANAGVATLALPPGCLPRGLRTLAISGAAVVAGDLGWLPWLTQLELRAGAPFSHPTVRTVKLRDATRDDVAACAAGLPGTTALHVAASDDAAVVELVASGWLARLQQLELSGGLDEAMLIELLDRGLAGRRLARLTIHVGGISAHARDHFATLCDELDCWCVERPPAAPRVVEHATRPEWGRGTLVREADGKVVIQFADARRTFKAGAPFLRWLSD